LASDDPEMQAAGGAMLGAAAMGGVPKVIRQAGAGAKNAKKAREQQLKEYEDFDYPDAEESIRTQITTTKPTYIKANQYLDDQQAIGKTLDYGAGLGFSKEMLGYDMFEPNTARGEALGVTYDFTDSKAIPDSQYERVVNLNVLNVVSPQVRDFIVEDIARVMKPGGSAIITTRGRDVLNAQGRPGPEPMSLVTSTGTYQKGFTNPELKEYIETVLGEGYDVKSISLGGAGVYVKKKSNQIDIATQASSGVRVPMPDKQLGVGKRVGYDYYVHKSAEDVVPNDVLSKAKEKIGDFEYDIVKYNNKDNSISFIESPDFDVVDEPTVGKSIKVSADGQISGPRKGGVTVYHHKWNMVRPDYIGFDYQDAIERSVRWTQMLEGTGINRNKIGNKNYWETVIIPMLNNE
jgi:hypothetical protein